MIKKTDQIISSLYNELGLLLSISFGVFLFILFFQPFPLNRFDFNNNLLFVAGFATIVFMFMFLVRIATPWIIENKYKTNNGSAIPVYLSGFSMLALNSVAFAFYLRYVGLVEVSFFIMLKVSLICLSPSIILRIYDIIHSLSLQNELLIFEKKIIQKQIEKYEEDYLNKSIDFISENSTETLNLLIADVVLIKSADNYVEIVYKDGLNFSRKLIRNTLKNIEQQLRHYSNFIRCHRICIVNMHYIEKLNTSYNNHWLTIKGYDEQIPVSRQYLLKLKEAI